MELGDKVRCAAVLKRRERAIKGWHALKFWDRLTITPRDGMYIGTRQLSNGERWFEDEVGAVYEPKERFVAALVVFSPRENPVFVPMDALEALP